jgi:hypothetical protein
MNFHEMNDKLNAWFNETADTIKRLPNDEKISWSSITVGSVLVISAVILW